ncbi:MAG TPA: alpha/beta hydrolase [Xanthobacteraceae bacterium]|nr:alpha/beta hydrolase [Xanthobacteraceae bacterium]
MAARATTEIGRDVRRTAQPRWFTADGVALRALEFAGSGDPIVVVPGITSPAATWTFVVEALRPARWIMVLDARGRGASDKPQTGYSTRDYVGDLKALIDTFGLQGPILVGHSMGARVVAAFDVAFPGKAKALVVIDPPMSGPGRRPYPIPVNFYVAQRQQVLSGASLADLTKSAPTWSEERIRDRMEWLPSCSEAAIRLSHVAFHSEGFLENWSGVTARALFIRGANSPVVEPSEFVEAKAANPNADYVEITNSGHMIPWDNLVGFADALGTYLEYLDEHERFQEPPSASGRRGNGGINELNSSLNRGNAMGEQNGKR